MPDPRFFIPAGPFTLGQLAAIATATLRPGADAERRLTGVASLADAGQGDVSFLENRRYLSQLAATKAGACLIDPRFADRAPAGVELLLTDKPYRGFALVAQAFFPEPPLLPGIHPKAAVDPSAAIGDGSRVDAGAVIGARVEIGRRCWIGANAVIGDGVKIGDDTVVGPCAVLAFCLVGSRVLLHPGVCIGNRGFGFAMDAAGHVRIPQTGRVIVEDDVEIGANAAIDRGMGPDTVIGRGTMIDNQVMIGHNARLGQGCVVVAQAGISGSTRLGNHVVVAAKAGLAGHLTVGDGARIAAAAGVMRDVAAGTEVGGAPAVPLRQWHRQTVALARLAKGKSSEGDL